jgi:hypothetical protein
VHKHAASGRADYVCRRPRQRTDAHDFCRKTVLRFLVPVRYNARMKTLTITEGRGRLGYWLKKATQGEDIGFVVDGKVVALRPVEVHSADYALQEYGLSAREIAAAEKRIGRDIKAARARGEVTAFTGSKRDFD